MLDLAREQSVSGLVYEALSMMNRRPDIPEDVSLDLMMDANKIETRSRYLQTLGESIVQTLNKTGLHPLIMKGPMVADMYPMPSLRVSGDIDIFLPVAEVQKAREILLSNFQKESFTPNGSWHYKVDGYEIDLHSHYFDLAVSERHLPPVPSPEATLLMLSSHILKYAMGPGVSLKQICDMVVASRNLKGKYDPRMLRKYFRNAGVTRWNKMLASLIRTRFEVETGFFPVGEEKPFLSLETIVFAGGNFGHRSRARKLAITRFACARKIDTAVQYLLRLPFSLLYAPKEYIQHYFALFKGNLAI